MSYAEVTDPKLLEQLESQPNSSEVTDPNILAQLEGTGGMPSQKGWKGVWEDIKGIPGKIPEALVNAAGGIQGAAYQIGGDPSRAAKNIIGGVPQTAINFANMPFGLRNYLVSKGLAPKELAEEKLPEELGGEVVRKAQAAPTEATKFNFPKALGVEGESAGDTTLQNLIPMIFGARSMTGPISSRGIINAISRDKQALQAQAANDFGQLFHEADQAGHRFVPATGTMRHNADRVIDRSTRNEHEMIQNYLEVPSIENAHWAQSEAGRLIRDLEAKHRNRRLRPSEMQTLHAAQDLQNEIESTIFRGHPELNQRYQQLQQAYATENVPYNRLKPVSEHEAGLMSSGKAVRNLRNDDLFMLQLRRRYPGIFLHGNVSKALKTIAKPFV